MWSLFADFFQPCSRLSRGYRERVFRAQTRSWAMSVSPASMRKKQKEDMDLAKVFKWVEDGKKPQYTEVLGASPTVRRYWNYWDNLTIIGGVLYRKFHRKDATGEHLQLLVPKCLQQEVLEQMHNSLLSGHLGRKKTKEKLLQRFYWFDVRTDINIWVNKCDSCGAIKLPNKTVRAPLGSMPVGAPMDRLATDIMGPLPETSRGNKYILVVTDHFSKWVEAFAIPDQNAVTVAEKILNEVICRFGCPLDIHSDQGRNYESKIFTVVSLVRSEKD